MKEVCRLFGIPIYIDNEIPDGPFYRLYREDYQHRIDQAEKFIYEKISKDMKLYPIKAPHPRKESE